ncbi:MAG: DNA-directed RNA polymerase subunit K [archaeon]
MYTANKLTRFERARIIGARALQISMGAPILIKTDITDPTEVAVAEFKKRVVPMTVVRRAEGKAPLTVNISEADLEEMLF